MENSTHAFATSLFYKSMVTQSQSKSPDAFYYCVCGGGLALFAVLSAQGALNIVKFRK